MTFARKLEILQWTAIGSISEALTFSRDENANFSMHDFALLVARTFK